MGFLVFPPLQLFLSVQFFSTYGQPVQQVRVDPDAAPQNDAGGIRMLAHALKGVDVRGVDTGHALLAESAGEDGVDRVEEEDLHGDGAVRRPSGPRCRSR